MVTSLVLASISLFRWSSDNQTSVSQSLQLTVMSAVGEIELNPFPAASTPIFKAITIIHTCYIFLAEKVEM